MKSHFNGKGSKVTQQYKPVCVIKTIPCFSKAYGLVVEKNITLVFAEKYGWSNVRVSYWYNPIFYLNIICWRLSTYNI